VTKSIPGEVVSSPQIFGSAFTNTVMVVSDEMGARAYLSNKRLISGRPKANPRPSRDRRSNSRVGVYPAASIP
jgi:hypothetical protein